MERQGTMEELTEKRKIFGTEKRKRKKKVLCAIYKNVRHINRC